MTPGFLAGASLGKAEQLEVLGESRLSPATQVSNCSVFPAHNRRPRNRTALTGSDVVQRGQHPQHEGGGHCDGVPGLLQHQLIAGDDLWASTATHQRPGGDTPSPAGREGGERAAPWPLCLLPTLHSPPRLLSAKRSLSAHKSEAGNAPCWDKRTWAPSGCGHIRDGTHGITTGKGARAVGSTECGEGREASANTSAPAGRPGKDTTTPFTGSPRSPDCLSPDELLVY